MEHNVTLQIHLFPCLADNYGFLVRDSSTGSVACIDTPDVDAIMGELQGLRWPLHLILNTHWHPDHAGGNLKIKALTHASVIAPAEVERVSPVDKVVCDGDSVMLGDTRLQVLDVGGHTLGHIAYYAAAADVLFAGDTLFPMGCGRIFEGTPAQMWGSLQKLAGLPDRTTVYSAHEYTLANARFALHVDDSPAVAARARAVQEARSRLEPTVPTTMQQERSTNPFLRAPLLAIAANAPDDATAFGIVRAAKDNFKG
jgi:hydroxyacylglutathione hydrolase